MNREDAAGNRMLPAGFDEHGGKPLRPLNLCGSSARCSISDTESP